MWTDHLAQELENRNLGMAESRAVLLRLLDKQVIYRHESQVEAELYDLFVRLQDVVETYLSITKKEMPAAESERRSLFNTLKQLRLVKYSDLAGTEQWIGIREIIMHFTLNGIVAALEARENGPAAAQDAEPMASDPIETHASDQEEA
jgi:hypothetical protein